MTDAQQVAAPDRAPARDSPLPAAGLQLGGVQLVYAAVVVLVFAVFTLVHDDVWTHPSSWIAVGGIGVATVLSLVGRESQWRSIVVPAINLAAITVLIADAEVPRIIAMLAVVPAFWLGIAGRRMGIGLVVLVSIAAGGVMALRIPHSTGVTLTANAVGTVLVPLSLVGAAWFADQYARTIERQQRAILDRERDRAAIAKQRDADAQLLDAIFETARVGLLLLDSQGHVVRVNSTFSTHPSLAGDGVDAMLDGVRFLELDSRRAIPQERSPFLRAARGEAFDNVVCWISRPGHDLFAITMSSRPLMIDGEFRGSIASVDDVTAYMRMLEDRDDFVALVSHELRTPLTSIQGFLELALDEDLPESLRSWLSIVQRNADRLRALVEDLLIVGEMSRGELHLETQPADLRALAEDAVATLAHRARRRGVELRLVDGPGIGINADARRVTQVIENLISNGIKYTRDEGFVEVRIEADGADARLSVVDDGPGLAPAEAARVFERFYRSAEARASGVQGAGLGLWICRMIVHAHGGSMEFESEVGTGSTATFRLPRAA